MNHLNCNIIELKSLPYIIPKHVRGINLVSSAYTGSQASLSQRSVRPVAGKWRRHDP